MPDRTAQEQEIKRLQTLNSRLNEQVKLLVQIEQRLHRSQWDRDQEFRRVSGLADFALEYSSEDDTGRIVTGAVRLLMNSFDIDYAFTVIREPERNQWRLRLHRADGSFDSSAAAAEDLRQEWVSSLQHATLFTRRDEDFIRHMAPLLDRLESLKAGRLDCSGDCQALCIPLRHTGDELFGYILVLKRPEDRVGYFKHIIGKSHIPFIRLLGGHLQRALHNAVLTRDLKQRSSELGEANLRLKTSLFNLEQTQQQLLQAQKMQAIGRLAGGIAHDFNNLLTVIMGHAQLIKLAARDMPTFTEEVDSILEAGERAARLTTQLLGFSRKQQWKPEVVDLNRLASGLAKMLSRLIGEKIEFLLDVDNEIGAIRADRNQVEQIIMNLVVNARDAMPGGGTLTVTTRRAQSPDLNLVPDPFDPAGFVALTVSDTGYGMDSDTKRQIFEPFFTTKSVGQGTGMGLATVYGLVQQSGGQVGVASQIGVGSVFTVLLPRATGVDRESEEEPEAVVLDQGCGTILLAEDEEFIRKLTCRILTARGYKVLTAANGAEALTVAEREISRIDLLLTDVVMPGLGGAELARELRRNRPDLPVLYMSGYAFEALDLEELGERELYLPKPFTSDVLLKAIGKLLTTTG